MRLNNYAIIKILFILPLSILMFLLFTRLIRPCLTFQSKIMENVLEIFVQYRRFEVRRDAAYNSVILEYNHIFQHFKTAVLPFHEKSESDYGAESRRKITEFYFIDCFHGTGRPPSQIYTKLDSNVVHLCSYVRNRNRPGCAHITGAS